MHVSEIFDVTDNVEKFLGTTRGLTSLANSSSVSLNTPCHLGSANSIVAVFH